MSAIDTGRKIEFLVQKQTANMMSLVIENNNISEQHNGNGMLIDQIVSKEIPTQEGKPMPNASIGNAAIGENVQCSKINLLKLDLGSRSPFGVHFKVLKKKSFESHLLACEL